MQEFSEHLKILHVSNSNKRQLYDYINFYRAYPQIASTVSAESLISSERLLNNRSYSMFKMLVEIDDGLKRNFYEIETIKGNWSVRELKRQQNNGLCSLSKMAI